ncbi:MAG TPA: homocysteine S-methyltransferase family protein [Anaerolineae bacterium]|mgnify:CR=1 FL=1|nr:homocysteine S-methyltransferase family protein [Anaerolineae bacterium]HOQ99056.1 homocysteine S-methyltransferase family protein [Anaerolineae bacterium]HPL27820.1 homocysteine S-methyltransferase family protein [Anaerolineae bacterium]
MPADILSRMCPPSILVADGAIGTYLQARGLPPGTMPELWNVEQPEIVRSMHEAYLAAGAQILTTNTFGGNRLRLPDQVNGHGRAELVRRGVELARQVAGAVAWVAGSMGPTGRLIEPLGDLRCEQAEDAFAEQAAILAEAGADVILVETMSDVLEARAALRAARRVTNLPVFVTFAFDDTGRTVMGATAEEAAREVQTLGADAVGANCGEGPEAVVIALREMRRAVSLPLIAQPNAGMPHLQAGETTWDTTPDEFAEHARTLIDLGASVVGACCGSTPAHVLAIRAAVDVARA